MKYEYEIETNGNKFSVKNMFIWCDSVESAIEEYERMLSEISEVDKPKAKKVNKFMERWCGR